MATIPAKSSDIYGRSGQGVVHDVAPQADVGALAVGLDAIVSVVGAEVVVEVGRVGHRLRELVYAAGAESSGLSAGRTRSASRAARCRSKST